MSTPAQKMVAEQLLPNGVTDPRVIEAMAQVPREEFLSGRLRRHADCRGHGVTRLVAAMPGYGGRPAGS